MTLVDLLIIYFAFGSPVMVHRYLINRRLDRGRRILVALTGLALWVPIVTQMGYHYITNAYSRYGFVSRKDLDVVDLHVIELRTIIRRELPDRGIAASLRQELFEALERYVALSTAVQTWTDDPARAFSLFSAAGTNHEIGSVCLLRRNFKHLQEHRTRARMDLLRLFSKAMERSSVPGRIDGTSLAVSIAEQLRDEILVRELTADASRGKDMSWPTQQQSAHQTISTPLSTLTISPTPPSGD